MTRTRSATWRAWAKKELTELDWLYEENDERLMPTVKTLRSREPTYDAILIDTAGFKSAMAMHAIAAAEPDPYSRESQ